MMSLRSLLWILAFATAVATWVPTSEANVISTFDTSIDGWTGALVTHMATGGNPGGYVHFVDPDASGNSLFAPGKFLGDWSVYAGGTFRYDHRVLEATNVNQFVDYEIEISGPTDSAIWNSGSPPAGVTAWVSLTAPIQESAWSVTGDWSTLLSDVTQVRLRIEHVDDAGTDVEGIDNVRLTALPEPNSLVLACGGLMIMLTGATVRRRRQRSRRNR